MKIAIVSDTHDYIDSTVRLLELVDGCDVLIHCGDHCAPFIFKQFSELSLEQHHITGNNLGDPFMSKSICDQYEHMHFYRIYGEFEFDGVRIAAIHYPEPALRIAQSGQFDIVCYGHTHESKRQKVGDCMLVNPGAIMGNKEPAQFCIFDTQTQNFETIFLE